MKKLALFLVVMLVASIAYGEEPVQDNGDDTATFTFTVTAAKNKVFDIGEDAGRYFYYAYFRTEDETGQVILWENLTNPQKLLVMDKTLKKYLKEGALAWYVNEKRNEAAQQAIGEGEIKYDIGQ